LYLYRGTYSRPSQLLRPVWRIFTKTGKAPLQRRKQGVPLACKQYWQVYFRTHASSLSLDSIRVKIRRDISKQICVYE
jgi:hypothetical protein